MGSFRMFSQLTSPICIQITLFTESMTYVSQVTGNEPYENYFWIWKLFLDLIINLIHGNE